MDTLSVLNVTSHVADTIHRFATYNWNKKSIIQLAIVSSVFIGAVATIKYIDEKSKESKKI